MRFWRSVLVALCWLGLAAGAEAQPSFLTFESGAVRPLAVSPGNDTLYMANIPDGRIEVFALIDEGIRHDGHIDVGMEPVALAVRGNGELWVVNHLSDSVSVVDPTTRRVTRTLLVGDEPRDIVITDPDGPEGPLGERVFITAAHRGQHRNDASLAAVPGAGDPELMTAGIGRADVWVFDASSPGAGFGGTPLAIVELFGDTPRALAVSPDGATVYAAVFHSGNRSAAINEASVCDGFGGAGVCAGDGVTSPGGLAAGQLPGGVAGPATNHQGHAAPEVGVIVQQDPATGVWRDVGGRNWSNGIRFDLPDQDVFAINANTLGLVRSFTGVGTVLFNMVANPQTGLLYVTNTDARNLTQFEGPGVFGSSTVQGELHRAQVSVLDPSDGSVSPRHLNKHIDYNTLPAPAGTADHSLATPTEAAVSDDGSTLYVAAFGSSRVGVFDTSTLEDDSFDPATQSAHYIDVSGGGPGGLVLDEARQRLYVFTRFDNALSVVDLTQGMAGSEFTHVPVHSPEPGHVIAGRPVLYDATRGSSNGEASCASCHIFGDIDGLVWDLGDPDGNLGFNPQTIELSGGAGGAPSPINGTGFVRDIHPMKGPMTTQTLRGMRNSGHMHWRGDRADGFFGQDALGGTDSRLSFLNFIVAFEGLLGADRPPEELALQDEMDLFADFALDVVLPPNPVRRLDNQLRAPASPSEPSEQRGFDFYTGGTSDGVDIPNLGFNCEGCHRLDAAQGFFGTGGAASFEAETQIVKIPHLRNAYQKVGMFGMPAVPGINPGDNNHKLAQVRGTGFLHDGSVDTMFRFLQGVVFNAQTDPFTQQPTGFQGGDNQRRDVEAFMLVFDTDLAPIVGQQITLSPGADADTLARVDLLVARAGTAFVSEILGGNTTECDLVAKGRVGNEERGWRYNAATAMFESDRAGDLPIDDPSLRALANQAGQDLTYTCVAPGSGTRAGIDRDLDGALDRDELDANTEPDNPGSLLGACNDGIDNDGDGLIDGGDGGCAGTGASIENPGCNDGFDNNNDGLIDLLDPSCSSASGVEFVPEPGAVAGLMGLACGFAALSRRRPRCQ